MADKNASDIFLSVGAPINIKINGVAMPVNQTVLNADAIRQLLHEVLTERQSREYEDELELNTADSMHWGLDVSQSEQLANLVKGQPVLHAISMLELSSFLREGLRKNSDERTTTS